MTSRQSDVRDQSKQRQRALQRWENEGGAGPGRLAADAEPGEMHVNDPPLSNAELVQLQIRVIALENLVIALLSQASDRQLDLARAMVAHISPRPSFTAHRLTIHAAAQMISLVERAGYFRAPGDTVNATTTMDPPLVDDRP
ncbi:MAG TPA: hypothetical protein VF308_14420 [Caldimonas sp.]